jgi:predicted RNase H-like HicB family nuclease
MSAIEYKAKGKIMIRKYIQAGIEHVKYEILSDDGTFYGELRECPGVYSNASTLEKCRNKFEEVLEEWILFRVYKNLEISPIKTKSSIISVSACSY